MDATLTVDTSPFSQVDRRFFAVLFGSMLLHAMAATWVARQPHVVTEEPGFQERPRERVTLPPLVKIPKSFPPLLSAGDYLISLLPPDLEEQFREFLERGGQNPEEGPAEPTEPDAPADDVLPPPSDISSSEPAPSA